jgi:hypothetical protein
MPERLKKNNLRRTTNLSSIMIDYAFILSYSLHYSITPSAAGRMEDGTCEDG